MTERAYVVNVDGVVLRNDRYLLIERGAGEAHAAGVLAFPGGTVECAAGEENAIEETVRRELLEEIGVEVGSVEYVHSSTFEADDGTRCLNVVTRCEYVGGEARARSEDEVAAVHWLSYDELKAREDVPSFTERFAERVEDARAIQ